MTARGGFRPALRVADAHRPARKQLVAGAIAGLGPFPTRVGVNFDALLQTLGVPAAPNRTQPAFGLLPAAYPASW